MVSIMSSTETLLGLALRLELCVVPSAVTNPADECVECESNLQLRICVSDLLNQVERVMRSCHERGDFEAADHLDAMLLKIRTAWASRIQEFERWIERCLAAGFHLGNLSKYRECVEDVTDWFEQRHLRQISVSPYQEI